jgi:hypothetical protein
MSNLDAMEEWMATIVFVEKRTFSYKDFLEFTINNKIYKMAHGTIRNNISKLIKEGQIERINTSGIALYTLKGVHFTKSMTDNHMGVSINHPFYRMIQELPLEKNSIHNIRLRFAIKDWDIWKILSIDSSFKINPFSKDIQLASWQIVKDIFVGITLHRTNTVSITIGCSFKPFSLGFQGIIDFTTFLTRIEERIRRLLHEKLYTTDFYKKERINSEYIIPSYKEWLVTMWHFGADSKVEYSGEKFSIKWDIAEKIFVQIYTKEFKDKKVKIRLERLEVPNKTLVDVIEQKINNNNLDL